MRQCLTSRFFACLSGSAALVVVLADTNAHLGVGENEENVLWEVGTQTYFKFEDGWYDGVISGFNVVTGKYETTWSDGDVQYFDDVTVIDQMVSDAEAKRERDQNYKSYGVGTKVFHSFGDYWYDGTISAFDGPGAGIYETTWSDGAVIYFDDLQMVDQMVANALELDKPYGVGTKVFYKSEDGAYDGSITSFDSKTGKYETTWIDGDVDVVINLQMASSIGEVPGDDAYHGGTLALLFFIVFSALFCVQKLFQRYWIRPMPLLPVMRQIRPR